jgi:hypothetical protein
VREPGFSRGLGRDFGGGRGQGYDGSHGEGYGASLEPDDYRAGLRGAGLEGAETRPWTTGPRGEDLSSEAGEHDGWRPLERDADDGLSWPDAGLGPDGWRRADARLRDRISEHLMEDRILDARGVEVVVHQGVVTLLGLVRHASDVKLAEILAREAAQGAEVRNRLRGPVERG